MERLARVSWLFGLAGFLALLVYGSLWYVTGEPGAPYVFPFGIAAGVLLAAYGFLDRESLASGAGSRAFRYGSGATAMVLLAGCVAVAGYVLAKQHDTRWEWTTDQRFTLSERSRGIARELERDVEVYAFFRSDSPEHHQFRTLIEGFQDETDRITVHFADPLRHPRLAERFTITSEFGTVILQSGEDRQRLESRFDEEAVAHALTRLVSGEDHRLCWTIGHGEADPDDDAGAGGLGVVVLKLEDQNYTVTKSNVLTEGVDRACHAVVIARPVKDWLPVEREALAAYVAEGGRVLAMLEPGTVPELSADLERYGVLVGNDVVLDPSPGSQLLGIDDPAYLVLSEGDMALHPITEPLDALLVLGVARSVKGNPMLGGARVHELLSASEESWGETSLDAAIDDPEAIRPDEGVDLVGNVPLAVAVQVEDPSILGVGQAPPAEEEGPGLDVAAGVPADFAPAPGGRLVVLGDSDFASNQLLLLGNNQDLFLNSIAWLVEEEAQLGTGPEDEGDLLTLTVIEEALLWLTTIFLIPGAAIALAVLMAVRRRFL